MDTFNNPQGSGDPLELDTLLLDRYVVGQVISDKGVSRIYKGKNKQSNKEVAIKELILESFILPDLKKQVMEQFQIEVKILLTLLHPNLPRFEDYFEADGRRYMVMEYIEGEKLEEYIIKKKDLIDQNQALTWALELCNVLEYLHTRKPKPIIFRSLCPENIIITKDGKLKLIDFGISKIFDPQDSTLAIAKTADRHYSPVEQTVGRTDERTDIYSLGATLYFILTKKPPLESAHRTITKKPLPSPKAINRKVSTIFERIIFRATESDPDKRFQNISEIKNGLKKLRKKPEKYITHELMSDELPLEQKDNLAENISLESREVVPLNLKKEDDIVREKLFQSKSPSIPDKPVSKEEMDVKELREIAKDKKGQKAVLFQSEEKSEEKPLEERVEKTFDKSEEAPVKEAEMKKDEKKKSGFLVNMLDGVINICKDIRNKLDN